MDEVVRFSFEETIILARYRLKELLIDETMNNLEGFNEEAELLTFQLENINLEGDEYLDRYNVALKPILTAINIIEGLK